jgi:transcription antitermination factor NusG
MLDSAFSLARCEGPDARGPALASHASCDANGDSKELISSKFGHGGPRANSGGPRENSGGRRVGAGRPCKVAPMPLDVPRWYVVRTLHGMTAVADREIRLSGFEVFAPTIFKPSTPPRRDSTGVMRPGKPDRVDYLFVRYIITRMNLANSDWRRVLACDGVERVISGGHSSNGGVGIPIAVPDEAIDWVRQLLGPNGCIDPRVHREKAIKVGTSLRLLDGPMPDRIGVCEMSDGARVVLLMNLLGRPVRVTVAQSSVQAV